MLIPVRTDGGDLAAAEKPLPAVLQTASRGAGGGPDPFLANVVVEESYTHAAVGRGEAPDTRRMEDGRKLLALEAAAGTTTFIRSDRLQEELARLYPEAVKDGQIDLWRFRDREAASCGAGGLGLAEGLGTSRITLAILPSNSLRLLSSTRSFRRGGRACKSPGRVSGFIA